MRTQQEVLNAFMTHATTPERQETISYVRAELTEAAMTIFENCPETPERTIALRKLEEAQFYAIASLARP